jgi:uncharacterized protein YdbL (DUF1318 family)
MLYPSRSFEPSGAGSAIRRTRRGFATLLLAGFCIFAAGAFVDAWAQSRLLDAPRAAGTVGERYDGFAIVRGAASPDIAALVSQVNAERRAVYAQRAANDKANIEAVGRIYAAEIMKSAPPKTWFLTEAGQWTQK